jgi:hypothetical protein
MAVEGKKGRAMSWSKQQHRDFAKQIRDGAFGRAWAFFTDDIRHAIISHYVLGIVCGQESPTVKVQDVNLLLVGVTEELADLGFPADDNLRHKAIRRMKAT